ncbi:hypothetical protein BV20DRAFT_963751 [Pilatotrama ljubarskyi]|nr:hypothetical protein BV20DRAFT_963751 [Pilatotrama ljubarskyi]
MAGAYVCPRIVPSDIGRPVTFSSGLCAGRTVRVELEEIQKADLGRKYARKDKRPLDPPPVVVCRYYEVLDTGSGRIAEQEIDPEQVAVGAICHVDLFPVPNDYEPDPKPTPHSGFSGDSSFHLPPIQAGSAGQPLPFPVASHLPEVSSLHNPAMAPVSHPWQSAVTLLPMQAQAPMSGAYSRQPPILPGFQDLALVHQHAAAASAARYHGPQDGDIVAWYGAYPIREDTKCTHMLSGGTFMQCSVLHYKGRKTAMFVFSDLAVKIEGTFVLRYRTLNVLSESSSPPYMPVLAECFGGPFKIYSTKDFPGLRASTELTRHLALYGVRVNLRETERKRRKKDQVAAGEADPQETPQSEDDPMHSGKMTGRSTPAPSYSPTSPYVRPNTSSRSSAGTGPGSSSRWRGKHEPSPDERNHTGRPE